MRPLRLLPLLLVLASLSGAQNAFDKGYDRILCDSVNLPRRSKVNFLGATSCIDSNGTTVIQLPAGGGGSTTSTTTSTTGTTSSTTTSTSTSSTTTSLIVAGGPTGDATHVPVITWNKFGDLTAVTSTAITGPFPPNGAASGDLTGSYPGPTVSKINGVAYNADPLAQYFLLAGRTGNSNNATVSSDTTGSITGSATTGNGLSLAANAADAVQATLILNGATDAATHVRGGAATPGTIIWDAASGKGVGLTVPATTGIGADLLWTLPTAYPGATGRYMTSTTGGVLSLAQVTAAQIGGGAALTKTDDTNVTLTLGGTPASSLLAASSLTLGWTGQLSIARGGTNGATALAGFNNLSPLTTRGDLLTRDASNNVRLGIGGAATYLRSNATDPSWQTIPYADISGTPTSLPPSGSASGDLSGTYPGPTVAKINGVTLGTTTATAGNLLVGSGSQWATQALSGDATLSSGGVLTLASTITAGGPTGDATHVPQITYDAKGRLTAVSSVAISGAGIDTTAIHTGAAAGGDLTGTYPNPTVADADLIAIRDLASTAGMLSRTGAGAFAARTLTVTAPLTITNPTGAAGNPTFSQDAIVDPRALGAKCDGATTSGVESGTDDTTALNTMAANTTLVIPQGKLCVLSGPLTIPTGGMIRCETGAGFLLTAKQCNAGTFIGAPCAADADCYNGGGSTTGLCTGTQFAPTGGTSYPVLQAPSGTPHRDFGVVNCNFWTMQVSPYYTCSGSGARAGKTCTTNNTDANTGCPTNGACSTAGTPLSPSGVGKINPIDASNALGRVLIMDNTIRDLRITDQAIKGGNGSATDETWIARNQQEPMYSGICCGTVFCGGSAGISGSNGQTCDFNYGFNPPATSLTAGIVMNDSSTVVEDNTVVGDTYGILVAGNTTLANDHLFVSRNIITPGSSPIATATAIYVSAASQAIIEANRSNTIAQCFEEDGNSANITFANNRCYNNSGSKVVVGGGAGIKILGNYFAWGGGASVPVIKIGDNTTGIPSVSTSHTEIADNTIYDDDATPVGIQWLDIGKRCQTGTRKYLVCTTNDCNASTGCPSATGCPTSCTGTCCADNKGGANSPGSHVNARVQNNLILNGGTGMDFSALTASGNTGLTNSIFSGNMIAGLTTGLNFPVAPAPISGLRFSSTHFGLTTNSLQNFDPSYGTIDSTIPLQPGDWSPTYAVAKYCAESGCSAGAASTTWQIAVADVTSDNAVTTSWTADATQQAIGVFWGSVADAGNATVVVNGTANCAVQGTVTRGDRLCISTTAGKGSTCRSGQPGYATALASGTTTNVLCRIESNNSPEQTTKLYVQAAGCVNATAASGFDTFATDPLAVCVSGTAIKKGVLEFDDANTCTSTSATTGCAFATLTIPSDASPSNSQCTASGIPFACCSGSAAGTCVPNVDATLVFAHMVTASTPDLTSGHTLIWKLSTSCTTPTASGAVVDNPATLNAAQTLTFTNGASEVAQALHSINQAAVTMTGCNAGDILHVRVGRDITDTITSKIDLLGLMLTFRRTQ